MSLTFKPFDGRGRVADRDDVPSWYPEWRRALELVISTGVARDRIKWGTPEREAAEREHDNALAIFREAGQSISVDRAVPTLSENTRKTLSATLSD
jgi:hypothetical protein